MRRTPRAIVGLAATAVIGTSGIAYGAGRPAGTSYVDETTDGGVSLIVSRDLHQVRTVLFAYKLKCSDGSTVYDYDTYTQIPITATRRFHYHYVSTPEPSKTTPGATFSYTEAASGLVNKQRTKIVGTARTTYTTRNPTGPAVTCDSGTVHFSADD